MSACFFEDLQTRNDLGWRGAAEGDAERDAVFDALGAALALVCCFVSWEFWMFVGRRGEVGKEVDVRGSMGCAASPTMTILPFVQVGTGAR